LDEAAVDHLLIRVHCEIQRLSEEFQHGQRMAEMLKPAVSALQQAGNRQLRVVDLGCGTGYVARWLGAHQPFEGGVEILGADYNVALIQEARRLASQENIDCSFLVANAFQLEQPADIIISTGVIHHFRDQGLVDFFASHNSQMFLHVDFQPSVVSPVGAWLFHILRMRDPLSRHDGVVSARRSYQARELIAAARTGAPDFELFVYNAALMGLPRVFHTIVGVRPEWVGPLFEQLGAAASAMRKVP